MKRLIIAVRPESSLGRRQPRPRFSVWGIIDGTVTDQQGGVLPGVTV